MELCYLLEEIPDLTLNKYASLDGSGVEGVIQRHAAFLRQWNRKGLLSGTSIHLFYYYDGEDLSRGDFGGDKGSRLQIMFMVRGDEKSLQNVPFLVKSSPLAEFYNLRACTFQDFLGRCRVEAEPFSVCSTLLKKEVIIHSSLDQATTENEYYTVPQWEMNEDGRLYTMMNLMESLNEKMLYRVDLFPVERSDALRDAFRKPMTLLRERQYMRMGSSGSRDYEADNVLRNYEDILKKVEESPHFAGNIFVFANNKENSAVVLDAAGAEALKTGSYEIGTFAGKFGIDALLSSDLDGSFYDPRKKVILQKANKGWVACKEISEKYRLRYLPTLFTVEEIVPFFCFPALYEGEVIQKRKETAPPTVPKDGGLYFGKDDNGYDVFFPLKNLAKHAFISGVPGSGKTNVMHHLTSTLWKEHHIPFLVLEPAKQEYRALLNQPGMEGVYLFSPTADMTFPLHINPFEFPKGLMVAEHIRRLGSVFEGAFPLDNPMPFLLDTAIEAVYRDMGWTPETIYTDNTKLSFPTMSMLYKRLEEELNATKYSEEVRGNLESALKVRIGSLLRREMGEVFDVPKSTISPERWLEIPAVIELESMGSGPANFLTLMLCALIRESLKVNPHYDKPHARHVIFIEEAHNLIGPESEEVSGTEANPKQAATAFVVKMLAEVRALKEGIVIADQLPTVMAQEVIKNTGLKIGLRITSADDRALLCSTMSANGLQIEEMATFQPGRALVSYEGLKRPFTMQTREWLGRWNMPECKAHYSLDWCSEQCPYFKSGDCIPELDKREKCAESLPDAELANLIRSYGPYREITEKSFEIEAFRFKQQLDLLEKRKNQGLDFMKRLEQKQIQIRQEEEALQNDFALLASLPEEASYDSWMEDDLKKRADKIGLLRETLKRDYLESNQLFDMHTLMMDYLSLVVQIYNRKKHWEKIGILEFTTSACNSEKQLSSERVRAIAKATVDIQTVAVMHVKSIYNVMQKYLSDPKMYSEQIARAEKEFVLKLKV